MKHKLSIVLVLAFVLGFGNNILFAQDEKRSKSGSSAGGNAPGTYEGPKNAAAQQPPPASPAQRPPDNNSPVQMAPPESMSDKKKSKRKRRNARKAKGNAASSEGTATGKVAPPSYPQ